MKQHDKTKLAEQKRKLTQTNFNMGRNALSYNTTTDSNHPPKSGQYFSKEERKQKADTNYITNFIDQETRGYEKQTQKPRFGSLPPKDLN
jgi:hypothetical protein